MVLSAVRRGDARRTQDLPLATDLDAIGPPIVPIGLGWRSEAAGDAAGSRSTTTPWVCSLARAATACRAAPVDTTTLSVLTAHGLSRQVMSSCPSSFDAESLGQQPDVNR